MGADPVELGIVASLNRPGGNATGISTLIDELVAKRLEILRDLLPKSETIAVLLNRKSPIFERQLKDVEQIARTLNLQLHLLSAGTDADLRTAFETLAQKQTSGLLVLADPFFTLRRNQVVMLAAYHRIPTIYFFREFAVAGGLMSYGPSLIDSFHRAGSYVGRILKGDKPADLPVQQAVKIELVINLGTARTFGLEVPATLLARADEVIE
jgi:putative ABC transport system substrate-binding protein